MLTCENLNKSFTIKEGFFGKEIRIDALKNINLEIPENRIIGLVGESGSGKSTLSKTILLLLKPDSGRIFYKDTEITNKRPNELKFFRKEVQAVFQDPYSSLNPRLTIYDTLKEPLSLYTNLTDKEIFVKISETLECVGISPNDIYKYPHEFSGGQRQRINIARAVILKPTLLIADEPVSSLDVSIQAQIINLFLELQKEYKFSMLFISHDLRIIRHISDEIIVMSKGEIVERGSSYDIFENTKDDYTRKLINSLPERTAIYNSNNFMVKSL
ncbi:MAG: ATP-binding cassette domain-containing protein [bacterium]